MNPISKQQIRKGKNIPKNKTDNLKGILWTKPPTRVFPVVQSPQLPSMNNQWKLEMYSSFEIVHWRRFYFDKDGTSDCIVPHLTDIYQLARSKLLLILIEHRSAHSLALIVVRSAVSLHKFIIYTKFLLWPSAATETITIIQNPLELRTLSSYSEGLAIPCLSH